MKIFRPIYRPFLALASAAFLGFMQMAGGILTELPTIRVNGQIMYYYDAQTGDNLYTIADKLGVSVEQIRANNPSVADGVKPRMRLLFPSDLTTSERGDSEGPLTHMVVKGESVYGIAHRYGMTVDQLMALNPKLSAGLQPGQRLLLSSSAANVGSAQTVTAPVAGTIADTDAETIAEPVAETDITVAIEDTPSEPASAENPSAVSEPVNVAVILPFMLDDAKMTRQTQLYTEFYKGFLLAASESNRDGLTPVRIHTYDSAASLDSVRSLMRLPEMKEMSLILCPDNPAQLSVISQEANDDALILNIFAVKDTSYLTIPGMIQVNIPHGRMYDRAIEGFLSRYPDAVPVFLSRKGGKTDKSEFTDRLKSALSYRGIVYRTIQFDGNLADSDLEELDPAVNNYVFIPASGNRDEFSRILYALKSFKERALSADAVSVFGYPEWSTFRGDQFKELCELNTTIYSRYNPTEQSSEASALDNRFREAYGEGIAEKQMPVLGILGYDTGRFVIDGLRQLAVDGAFPTSFNGIQSGIRLEKAPGDGGWFNNALFLISYTPGEIVTYDIVAGNPFDHVD